MSQHNVWLHWKMKHGLAYRGRPAKLSGPRGPIAEILYRLFFKKHDIVPRPKGPRVFKQDVGGSLGSQGNLRN